MPDESSENAKKASKIAGFPGFSRGNFGLKKICDVERGEAAFLIGELRGSRIESPRFFGAEIIGKNCTDARVRGNGERSA